MLLLGELELRPGEAELRPGEAERRAEGLELPHPEVLERRFVLEPLLELDPGLALPDGTSLAGALAEPAVAEQPVERLEQL